MDAAAAFHQHLETQRAALTPNQLKKQRKKRAKLFKQAAVCGATQNSGPTEHLYMDNKREESALLDTDHSSVALQPAAYPSSNCQLTGSTTSEVGTTAANATTTDAEVSQQRLASKRRKCIFLQPLKPFKARHSSQAAPRAQGGDLSAVMKALQHHTFSDSQEPEPPDTQQQEVLTSSTDAVAAATETHCSDESCEARAAVLQAHRGPCRADLSQHMAIINQQLSSDHSSSSAVFQAANSSQSSHLQQPQKQQDAAASSIAGEQQEQRQGGKQVSRKRQRPSCLYGNYHHYYGYRIGPSGFEDPRMKVLDPEWFRGADVLDIGCNEGLLTLALAVGCGCRSILGVDIDPGLVAKACTNLSRSRTQLTRQFREAVAARNANAGRRVSLPAPASEQQAAEPAAAEGPLSIIAAATAALATSSVCATNLADVATNISSNSSSTADVQKLHDVGQNEEQAQQKQQQVGQKPMQQPVPHQSQQQQPSQHRQQQHYSLQGRVVQLDRQLKSLSRVSFKCGNWLDLGCAANKYGVVTCFSVTKWIHLNWGDDGLMKLFHKAFRCLVPGGLFILEPQPFKSYQNAVHKAGVQAAPFKKISQFKLRPEGFSEFLMQRVGFELVQQLNAVSQVAGDEAVPVKGFDRPIVVLRKPVP